MTAEGVSRADVRAGAALAVSLLIHAAALLVPSNPTVRRTPLAEPPRAAVVRMLLRPPATDGTGRPSPLTTPGKVPDIGPVPAPVRAAPAARPAPSGQHADARNADTSVRPAAPQDEPAPAALDPDALHAQMQDAARQAAKSPFAPAPPASRERAAAPLLDRPLLDALARRIGRPLQVAGEQRLPDGSWRIRFTGGVCMHVPREFPATLDRAFGPNVALTTNCSE